jgi:hypothetical protein
VGVIQNRDLGIVVRTSGERTTDVCVQMLQNIFPKVSVSVVSGSPFRETLRKSLVAGMQLNAEWILCIDADVLPDQFGALKLYQTGRALADKYSGIEGVVLDKIMLTKRHAGNHLYRSNCLAKCVEILDAQEDCVRPETEMLQMLSKMGHTWKKIEVLVGVHDFEQNFSDLFRKARLHAVKHEHSISSRISTWKALAKEDPDFEAILAGVASGIASTGDLICDVKEQEWAEELKRMKFPHSEKSVLNSEPDVRSLMDNWTREMGEHITGFGIQIPPQETKTIVRNQLKHFLKKGILRVRLPENSEHRRMLREEALNWGFVIVEQNSETNLSIDTIVSSKTVESEDPIPTLKYEDQIPGENRSESLLQRNASAIFSDLLIEGCSECFIYGTGELGLKVQRLIGRSEISMKGWIESESKPGVQFMGFPVYSPLEALEMNAKCVIIASLSFSQEMVRNLSRFAAKTGSFPSIIVPIDTD